MALVSELFLAWVLRRKQSPGVCGFDDQRDHSAQGAAFSLSLEPHRRPLLEERDGCAALMAVSFPEAGDVAGEGFLSCGQPRCRVIPS
jgi:hypothetical protein